ncbi:MAG: Ig-like domain-containing protein, partial [Tepidisphaeraceae bacterium]
ATRSGNVRDTSAHGWSAWSPEQAAAQFVTIDSAAARFFQYRLTFSSADPAKTPVVDEVTVAYQMPNLAPIVKSVKASAKDDVFESEPKASQALRTVSWEATDPNNDALRYTLYYRAGENSPWILLKDRLSSAEYEWNTRTVSDGRYSVKIVATDVLANPPGLGRSASRVSDPIIVDNTPPMIGDVKSNRAGAAVRIELKAVDATSTIAALSYSIDSGADWQSVLPSDKIADSPQESYDFTVGGLSPGAHQIALRATDAHGNQAFATLAVNIEDKP